MKLLELLETPPKIVNIGVADFADALRMQGADVVEIKWKPSPKIDPEIERLLGKML